MQSHTHTFITSSSTQQRQTRLLTATVFSVSSSERSSHLDHWLALLAIQPQHKTTHSLKIADVLRLSLKVQKLMQVSIVTCVHLSTYYAGKHIISKCVGISLFMYVI